MHLLHELLALIAKIPPTFWGVVFGAFFSLGGVVLTNRANDRRLQAQLSHERELRKKERELSLLKDVYLAAVEAIATGINTIRYFPDMSIPYDKLMVEYGKKAPAIAKVYLIGGEETVKAIVHLISELSATYLQLHAKRIPLVGQKNETADFRAKLHDYMIECIDEAARLYQFVVPLLVAMRQELELPLSADIFRQIFEQGVRETQEHIRKFVESVE